ncbi:MAG: hypothetical protein ACR2ND_06465 [Solirubrobacteraceae bacterium]
MAANSGGVVEHMAVYGWAFQGGPSGFQITDEGSRPVYFAGPSDPVMTVNCTSEYGPGGCQGKNGVDVNRARINVPAGAKPGSRPDAHMTIVETSTGAAYDFFHATVSGSTITAGVGSEQNVNAGDGLGGGGDAANLALLGGLLRPSELLSGHINHALVIDVPCTSGHGAQVGYVWPATGGWGEYCGQYWSESQSDAPAIGQLFRLNMTDAQIAGSGAPAWEQTIMTALAHYGAYAEDTNGSYHDDSIYIFQQAPTSWTSLGQPDQWASAIAQLGGKGGTLASSVPIPTSKLEVVSPCVPQGACPGRYGSLATPASAQRLARAARARRAGAAVAENNKRRRRARTVRPALTRVILSSRRWRAASKLSIVSSQRRPTLGPTVSFRLNERARVRVVFAQKLRGHKVTSPCAAQTKRRRRHHHACRIAIRVILSFAGHRGINTILLQASPLRAAGLKAGRYTLLITATNSAGQRSGRVSRTFRIRNHKPKTRRAPPRRHHRRHQTAAARRSR